MSTRKSILILLVIVLYSCREKPAEKNPDPATVELTNKVIALVAFIDNPDSSKKAISFLEKATSIDSNNFLAHYNKLMFFNQLKQFDKAILTINKLIQLQPSAYDLYLTGGILYERIGDTIVSKAYFEKSLTICTNVLDTMITSNRDYEMIVGNKAINLIMLNDQAKANELLKKLYDSQNNDESKKMTLSIMNKTKSDLLELWANKK